MKIIDDRECVLCKGEYAYKDKKLYPLWKTKNTMMMGCCLGKMYYVVDGDEILSTALPMFSLNNGFEKLSRETIEKYGQIYSTYIDMQNQT